MSDAGAIGVIIEDTIDILKDMYNNDRLSEKKLQFAMILLKNINDSCKEQHIDLCMDEEYIKYMNRYYFSPRL